MKILIASVGGDTNEIVASISKHKPDYIIYYASHETVSEIGPIQTMLNSKGIYINDYTMIVDDSYDLVGCYKKALELDTFVRENGAASNEVIVDYSGGTKSMSSALILATINRGYNYSCIGKHRISPDKKKQSQVIKNIENPWKIFAIEEWKKLVQAFNGYQFASAYYMADILKGMVVKPQSDLIDALQLIIDGYWKWDIFSHKEAREQIAKGKMMLKPLTHYLERDFPGLDKFYAGLTKNLEWLNDMSQNSNGFKILNNDFIIDIMSNAHRRYIQGKYNDAVARLYRALEMIGQVAFKRRFKHDTDSVPPGIIPDEVKEEYEIKFMDDKKKKLKIPLYHTFDLLSRAGDKTGKRFFDNIGEFIKVLEARNASILAHGTRSLSDKHYNRFCNLIRGTFEITEWVEFPQLDLV